MNSIGRRKRLTAAAVAAFLLGAAPALSQLNYNFMPKGGKDLLLEIVGRSPDTRELAEFLSAQRNETEWREIVARKGKALAAREQETLVAYLAINMPMESLQAALSNARNPAELAKALPRDGRELGFYECQFCHSLFTSHLTQERTFQAWMNMFESPFHRELKMTRKEREEFSRYSEINMPMKIEDVPPDLRF